MFGIKRNDDKASTKNRRVVCDSCGKECSNDYFVMSIIRMKDGYLHSYVNNPHIMCDKCYTRVSKIKTSDLK